MACALYPPLLNSKDISQDAKNRASKYLKGLNFESSLGAYSENHGLVFCRESVKSFLEERDGHPADLQMIFLGNGASDVVHTLLQLLLTGPYDGVHIIIYIYIYS